MTATDAALDTELAAFFRVFSRASDELSTTELGACFDDVFLAGDETGAKAVSRQAFLEALPQRAQSFTDSGVGAAELRSVSSQRLDGTYVLARTEWIAPRFDGGDPIELASSFLLRRGEDGLRIIAYLRHQGLPSDRLR